MSLSSLSVRRPVTTLMFYAAITLVGIAGFGQLSVDFLPPVSIPRLTIHALCPDFSPEEMDEKVAQPVAASAGTVKGVIKTSTLSRRGTATVTVEFSWGIDMDYAMLETREKLDQLSAELPPEAERPTIMRIDPSAEPIMTIGVGSAAASSGRDSAALLEITETCNALLKKRLEQVDGVAQALVLGGVEREIVVEVDEEKLSAAGLSTEDVTQAIGMENASLSGGTIRNGARRYPLRLLGELRSAAEVSQVTLTSGESGRRVRLGEIAGVHDTVQERHGWTEFNGRDILVLQLRKEAGVNTLAVSRNVRQALERLSLENPGLRLDILSDQAEFIRNSIADVEQSILWGALLAFLVLFLFLRGLGDPFIVGVTMPVSILATLAAMSALNISLNVISLTGLAMGIGMLGDNATIVVENVRRLREGGLSLLEAIQSGSREINVAVTASTLTNVAVFLPVLFVRSVAQQLFVDMAVTMTVSLLVSLLVAVTLVPVLLASEGRIRRLLQSTRFSWPRSSWGPVRRYTELMDAWGKQSLEGILRRVLRARGRVLAFTGLLFAATVLAAAWIPSEPAPEIDRKRFIIDVTAAVGTSTSALAELSGRIRDMLHEIPGVRGVYVAGGVAANPDIWSVPDASSGHIRLEIVVNETMTTAPVMERAQEGMRSLCRSLAGVEFTVKPGATTFERILRPQSADLQVRIAGNDPAVNSRIAASFARQLRDLPGIADVNVPSHERAPEYQLRIDRMAAERYGVTPGEIATHLSREVNGVEATSLSGVDHRIVVRVQPDRLAERRIQDILSSHIVCNGTPIRLDQFVQCEQALANTEVGREQGTRTVAIAVNVADRSIGAVASELRQRAAVCRLPAGYNINIGGENEEMESSFRSLAVVIGLSLLLVYMILAAEYESLLYPFVILLSSPLALIGAVLAMLLTGERYNVMSLVGIVIMIGAVDNDAVIAVDVITALRRSGARLQEAILQGISQRLRPILMTTATTLLGILPLVLSLGEGSELVRALTIPLAGGLISSTLFTLIIIPVIYTYVDSWASKPG